ncbi:MAG: nucleotide-binding protein [Chthoniobacteraceae bacterium]
MKLLQKQKALSLLKQLEDKGHSLTAYDHATWLGWTRDLTVRVDAIFGSGSSQSEEIAYSVNRMRSVHPSSKHEIRSQLLSLIRSMHSEIHDLWEDEGIEIEVPQSNESPSKMTPQISKNVFVVHGHDHARMHAVARFIEHLGLIPIILHEQANQGATIVEKLEAHASVAFAVVLLTPDDIGASAKQPEKLSPRARQNVVLELGYFTARLGRKRTCALVVGGVEIPSDFSGIVYVSIDDADAWKFHLAREMKAAGLEIDATKLI